MLSPVFVSDDDEEEGRADRVLSRGESIVVAGNQWKSQQYNVQQSYVNDIVMRMGAGKPLIDCFATSSNKRFPHHWGPGGIATNAFEEQWTFDMVGLVWMNPPYSEIPKVVDKIRRDKAKVIAVLPDWPTEKWFQEVWSMVKKYHHYPIGTDFFELQGKSYKLRKWGVWAMLIDNSESSKTRRRTSPPKKSQETSSRKRIERRRKLEGKFSEEQWPRQEEEGCPRVCGCGCPHLWMPP
jgi:hypothetical protein